MNEKDVENEEYVYQHFEITSKLYLLYLKLNVSESISLLFDKLEKRFEEEDGTGGYDLSDAREQINAVVGESVQTIEEAAKQFFSIPDNVLLLSDDAQKYSKEDIVALKGDLEKYKDHYMKQKTYIAFLEKELHDLEKMDPLKQRVNELIESYKESRAVRGCLKSAAKDVDKRQISKEMIEGLKASRYICDESKLSKIKS